MLLTTRAKSLLNLPEHFWKLTRQKDQMGKSPEIWAEKEVAFPSEVCHQVSSPYDINKKQTWRSASARAGVPHPSSRRSPVTVVVVKFSRRFPSVLFWLQVWRQWPDDCGLQEPTEFNWSTHSWTPHISLVYRALLKRMGSRIQELFSKTGTERIYGKNWDLCLQATPLTSTKATLRFLQGIPALCHRDSVTLDGKFPDFLKIWLSLIHLWCPPDPVRLSILIWVESNGIHVLLNFLFLTTGKNFAYYSHELVWQVRQDASWGQTHALSLVWYTLETSHAIAIFTS